MPSRITTTSLLLSFSLPCALLLCVAAVPPRNKSHVRTAKASATKGLPVFARDVAPLLKKYCVSCHSGDHAQGGLSLAEFKDAAGASKASEVWEKVQQRVNAGEMPPSGLPKPTDAERKTLSAWVEGSFSAQECKLQNPGHVTLRRLNREEYNNTIRDLTGLDTRPADSFPSDDVGYGFDNIGDVLSLSPLLMEKYMAAADKISQTVILTPEAASQPVHVDANHLQTTLKKSNNNNGLVLYTQGEAYITYNCTHTGEYTIRANAYGEQAGPDPARMAFHVDDRTLTTVDVKAEEGAPKVYEVKTSLAPGKHRLSVEFTNDFYDENIKPPQRNDRNLVVEYLEVAPPKGTPADFTDAQKRIFSAAAPTDSEDMRARKILSAFATHAYRRPVTAKEGDRLLACYHMARQEGGSFERGIQLGVQAVLVSPNFLFHVEADKAPHQPNAMRALNNYELASRLSYFLWSSMPDDTLFTLALQGKLQNPTVLNAQVKRMLKDPKAHALADNFAGQWLQLRNLNTVNPNPQQFPDFNDKLRKAMRTETEMFFEAVVQEDRSVLDFLDGKFTYLNGALAKHYGIDGVEGNEFRRVSLEGTQREGLLTQASILTVTSNPTRTSPVKRGKWVLDNMLGTPPPPPPPGVSALSEDKQVVLSGSLRQRMEQHRKNPVCASCHARMDPIGFGMENFDATGAWRTKDGGFEIDAAGKLPDGHAFKGPTELISILTTRKSQFVQCLSQKMLTYALGRGMESYDKCAVGGIVKKVQTDNYKFSALVTAIVQSDPFLKRREDGDKL